MNYLVDFYSHAVRQGPGDDRDTMRALSFVRLPDGPASVLDLGCGTGKQTVRLAKSIRGTIIALDLYSEFLEILNENMAGKNFLSRIDTVRGSMFELPFQDESFDLIWSEGAIYIMGFTNGVKRMRRFLRNDGYLVVSEISWLRRDIPREIRDYWEGAYPEIKHISGNIEIMEKNGYAPAGFFVLDEKGWLDNYYLRLLKHEKAYRRKYPLEKDVDEIFHEIHTECQFYMRYKDYYGYVFYIMKKDGHLVITDDVVE